LYLIHKTNSQNISRPVTNIEANNLSKAVRKGLEKIGYEKKEEKHIRSKL